MSFFTVGETYRDIYRIEHVEAFFEGELAIAATEKDRFYLQYIRLQKPAPPRAIQQYLSLKHDLIVPYLQVYSEERSLVMIRPYVPFKERLHERIQRGGMEEDEIFTWVQRLFPVEEVLIQQPLQMYPLLHPANIGITAAEDLQILFCGVEGRTLPKADMDWGNLLYMLFSGNLIDEPIKKLPKDADFPKQLTKLIQKSFNRKADYVSSQVDSYLKRGSGWFPFRIKKSSEEKKETSKPETSNESVTASRSTSLLQQRLAETDWDREREEKERLERERREQEERERLERERREQEERERLEQERREQEEKERLERERREREERERLERERREREERERLEQERREQEEKERLERERREREERERLERERREREERERLEQERREQEEKERLERERREREERERLEQERREQEEKERLEQERHEQEEKERLEQERHEQEEKECLERERREREERERLKRAEIVRQQQDQIAAQMEEYVKKVFDR
ncbi:hypothetical protein [Melghirimyces algeriensis]|uniref:Uncharacterized protein n=1 Tax=Melghirimyces algeriensis TaxID=910412 RepID=A0A521DVK9_9BACL|nr:hypothetical protein [Melghirimyces algeriensis]SMO75743.1 hypothetical protein SAMN06264849_10719 [Melghirimyces algeriensis]